MVVEQPINFAATTPEEDAHDLLARMEALLEEFGSDCEEQDCEHPLCTAIDRIDETATELGVALGVDRC